MIVPIALFSLLILSLLAAPCLRAAEPASVSAKEAAPISAKSVRAMSKEEVRKALEKIEKSDAPKPEMGAMCYKVAVPRSTVDYLCPTCGTKTHLADENVARRLAWDLEACRRLSDAIRKSIGADISLDESAFCVKCAAKDAKPELAVVVRFKDGSSKRTSPVTQEDLRILQAFFSGELKLKSSNDGSAPLKTSLPRLRELLGEQKEAK